MYHTHNKHTVCLSAAPRPNESNVSPHAWKKGKRRIRRRRSWLMFKNLLRRRQQWERGYANSVRMYILPFALTFSLYSLSSSEPYSMQCMRRPIPPLSLRLFLWECAAVIHSQSKLLRCVEPGIRNRAVLSFCRV